MQKRKDFDMWRMGAYVTNAVGVAVSNALGGSKSSAKYIDKPFSMLEETEEKSSPEEDFTKFSAWAVVFNEQFEAKSKQG